MSIFNALKFWKKKEVGGLIQGHGLQTWWLSLSDTDRRQILEEVNKPFSAFANLDSGLARQMPNGTKGFLVDLAEWFQRDDCRHLGRLIMRQAEERSNKGMSTIDLHFMYNGMIGFYYRCRKDDPVYLELCKARCRDMIAISAAAKTAMLGRFPKSPLPCHIGYGRLSWLLNKQEKGRGDELKLKGEGEGWIVSI